MNKKGFTLIELLASIVILSIIMLVAVPSTLSILDKNRKESFVSDAKRLAALAEGQIRNNDRIDTKYGGVIIFKLSNLNDGSFDKDPDGGKYNQDNSYVAVYKKGTPENYQFEYYIQLQGGKRGILLTKSDHLDRDSIAANTAVGALENDVKTAIGATPTEIIYYAP